MSISKEAIEAGARAMHTEAVWEVLMPESKQQALVEAERTIKAAFPRLQDCKESTPNFQSPPATATQVAIDDAEKKVARAIFEAAKEQQDWQQAKLQGLTESAEQFLQRKCEDLARAAIRAMQGQRWGVWLVNLKKWRDRSRDIYDKEPLITTDREAAEHIAREWNQKQIGVAEVRPYDAEGEKTPEDIAISELTDIAENGLRCDTNPTIQITTSANDTAMRYVKYIESIDTAMRERAKHAIAAIRAAKGGK